jgi:hypothetical protein
LCSSLSDWLKKHPKGRKIEEEEDIEKRRRRRRKNGMEEWM